MIFACARDYIRWKAITKKYIKCVDLIWWFQTKNANFAIRWRIRWRNYYELWILISPFVAYFRIFVFQEATHFWLPRQYDGQQIAHNLFLLFLCIRVVPFLKSNFPLSTEQKNVLPLRKKVNNGINQTSC